MLRIVLANLALIAVTGCLSPEYRAHLDSGNEAVRAGDYERCVSEMKTAIAIDPDVGSIPYRALGYCYQKLGRSQESWWAVRQAVLVNALSSENRDNFWLLWENYKRQGLSLGLSTVQVRELLGTPDMEAVGPDMELWGYGRAGLRFENGVVVEIIE